MDRSIDDMILRSLAAGSMATLLLVQDVGIPSNALRPDITCAGRCVTPSLDGAVDMRTVFLRDSIGIGVLNDQGTSIAWTMPLDRAITSDVADLPHLLKRQSGLAIEVLAKCVGVSKVTYHKWLNGAGISQESRDRLIELQDTLSTLTAVRRDLRDFLDMRTPAGTPLELLSNRQDAFVVGLATRGDQSFADVAVSETLEHAGLHRPRPIGWTRSLDRGRLEDFSPRMREDQTVDRDTEGEPLSVSFVLFQA